MLHTVPLAARLTSGSNTKRPANTTLLKSNILCVLSIVSVFDANGRTFTTRHHLRPFFLFGVFFGRKCLSKWRRGLAEGGASMCCANFTFVSKLQRLMRSDARLATRRDCLIASANFVR